MCKGVEKETDWLVSGASGNSARLDIRAPEGGEGAQRGPREARRGGCRGLECQAKEPRLYLEGHGEPRRKVSEVGRAGHLPTRASLYDITVSSCVDGRLEVAG